MDIRERLNQIEQAHAQHVQLLQQTQANIIRLEGAAEILREQVNALNAEEAAKLPPAVEPTPAKVVSISNRKARRAKKNVDEPPPA